MEEQNLPQEELLNQPVAGETAEEAPEQESLPPETPAEEAVASEPVPAEDSSVPETPQPAPAKKKKTKTGRVLSVIAILLVILSLSANAFSLWVLYTHTDGTLLPEANVPQSVTPSYNYRDEISEDDLLTTQEVIRKVNPSIVTVSVTTMTQGQTSEGIGTGIIYTDNGYILTNAHVVESAVKVTVIDMEGEEYAATVVGADSETDTAVLKIDATDLPAAEFGKASDAVPGDRVVAIGTPYAPELHNTATEGIVSAHRDDVTFSSLGGSVDLIQHDASINPGNSGGPLVNAYGQVIGINTMKIFGDYDNLGFAISIDSILPIVEQLMTDGKIVRPGIGITGYTYQTETLSGAYVESVVKDGPADKAGLKRGDVIIKAGDVPVSTIDELKTEIRKNKIGDSITLTYMRGNMVHTTVMVLEELKVD